MSNVAEVAGAGLAAGAIFSTPAGFTLGGWMTGSKAKSMVQSSAANAVVGALAPICAVKFTEGTEGDDRLVQLTDPKRMNEWERTVFIEEGGWAKMPGRDGVDRAVARICDELILSN